MRKTRIISLALVYLSGCSSAQSATGSNISDRDCMLVTKLFSDAAKAEIKAADQQNAIETFHQWFAVVVDDDGSAKRPDFTDKYVAKFYTDLGKNPAAAKTKFDRCMEKAQSDPKFEGFANLIARSLRG